MTSRIERVYTSIQQSQNAIDRLYLLLDDCINRGDFHTSMVYFHEISDIRARQLIFENRLRRLINYQLNPNYMGSDTDTDIDSSVE